MPHDVRRMIGLLQPDQFVDARRRQNATVAAVNRLESFKLKMIFKKIAELNSSIKLDTAKYET